MPDTRERWRMQLPHWEVTDRPHFVTIRCAGSLPPHVCQRLDEIRRSLRVIAPSSPEFAQLQRRYFLACEKYLDAGNGFAPFTNPKVAAALVATLQQLEGGSRWTVPHFVAMPNHVHLRLKPIGTDSQPLRQTLSQLKGRFARTANLLLQRTGDFWQSEWFDHWSRNDAETEHITGYIRQNPVKAGLVRSWEEYPWVR
ncbi:MAG: transposase [Opitutaceae bacterium]|nr:transposase [Opitutaceae bacterium]